MNNNITTKGLSLMNSKELLTRAINCFVMIFICKFSFAQNIKNNHPEDHYRAIHWTIDNGLSHPDISCMIKDIKGFLWMGTGNGLNKFDGNTFKYYFADKNQKTSIASDNSGFGLSEDSLHNIWIGTLKGISRYDIRADTFTNFSSPQPIIPFWAQKNEILCWDYYDAQAIVSYNIHSFARKVIATVSPADSLGGSNIKFIYTVFDETGKSIWMLPEDKKQGGLLQVSLIDGKRKFYPWPISKKNQESHRYNYVQAEAMRYDPKRNCIWINAPEGLRYFTLNDKQFHHLDALDQYTNLKDYDRFVGIDIDPKGRVWFATQPKGIIIYDPDDQSVELPFPNNSSLQSEAGEANACIYCDRDGIVWTGSWLKTGVYQLAPFSRVVTHYTQKANVDHGLTNNSVIAFAEGVKGTIWINTRFGMNIFDPASGKFDTLKNLSQFKKNNYENYIRAIFIDNILRKAILENPGLHEMDLDTKGLKTVILKDSAGNIIKRSADDGSFSQKFKNGCITIAYHNNRLGVFIITTDSAVAWELISFPAEEVSPGYIGTADASPGLIVTDDSLLFIPLQPDKERHVTYAYAGNKLIRIHIPLDSIQWNEIVYSKADRTYWVSAERQLMHYSKDFHVIRRYTPKEGLPPFDFSCLTLDNRNNLWFHTDRSVHQLNTKTGEFSQLSEKDGLDKIDFYNYPGSLKAGNGDIYFPTGNIGNGFVRINADKFVSPSSTVYIEAIEINQKAVSLATTANYVEELSLRYFENKINISTGILDFYSKGKSRIRYKLEGQDTNWQYSPYYTTIRYEGLATGKKYRLLMQGSNASNEFNGPMKSLFIYISPAFWDTWWFRIIAVIFVLGIFYVVIRYRAQQRFRLQLEKSERENQLALERSENDRQMAELQQQKTELEMQALRAQMNPHFIFNSLNSINRFILQNNRLQASEYLTKFSKLVRMILQNSQSALIPLESELESLGLYLEMEALRFNYHFDYEISVPKDLDKEVLKVPPLILQPYVENAIWHGLMHKEEKGQLNINISEENGYLYFKIADNGIGRRKASEIASKSATKHKSMGLKITANRIAMIQHSNEEGSPVKINDLTAADGSAAGTEVIIKMPVIEGD